MKNKMTPYHRHDLLEQRPKAYPEPIRSRRTFFSKMFTKGKKINSILQVMILLLGIIAISYAVGSEIGIVRAEGACPDGIFLQPTEGMSQALKRCEVPESEYSKYGTKDNTGKFWTVEDAAGEYTGPGTGPLFVEGAQVSILPPYTDNPNWNFFPSSNNRFDGMASNAPIPTAQSTDTNSECPPGTFVCAPTEDTEYTGDSSGNGFYTPDEGWKEPIDKKPKVERTLRGVGGALIQGIMYAGIVKFAVTTIVGLEIFGQTGEQAAVIGDAAAVGYLAYHIAGDAQLGGLSSTSAGWIGVGAMALYLISQYTTEDSETVNFECVLWEAPKGGENCEDCNNELLGCSEYQCKSLGKACQLLNPGTDEELCNWVNRNDNYPPEIRPWKKVLADEYDYTPDNTISPPDRGVKIINKTGPECIPAYTPLQFGISLDEPATCKIDLIRKDSYEEMQYYFGGSSMMRYNHSHIIGIPDLDATEIVSETGADMEIYTRCEDANGISNEANFVFKFCVDAGPDYTAPIIKSTSFFTNNVPVAYGQDEIDMFIHVNEPVNGCKWDYVDEVYDAMANEMDCSPGLDTSNSQIFYRCDTTLNGIQDRVENDFYFRCEDKSEFKNQNVESYTLTLIGTQPLFIDWAGPDGTTEKGSVKNIPITLEAQTSSGYQDGAAFCDYKNNKVSTSGYIQFQYEPIERTYQHSQDLTFPEGNYNYSIRCIDAGGNMDVVDINFDVEVDEDDPLISRAYKEGNFLKLITNEAGECVYSNIPPEIDPNEGGCNYEFEDGITLDVVEENEHFVEWDVEETLYIKCEDSFGTRPTKTSSEPLEGCSIIAKPEEII